MNKYVMKNYLSNCHMNGEIFQQEAGMKSYQDICSSPEREISATRLLHQVHEKEDDYSDMEVRAPVMCSRLRYPQPAMLGEVSMSMRRQVRRASEPRLQMRYPFKFSKENPRSCYLALADV